MRKTKNLSRVLSMALLPAQVFAATKNDDPTTWPAPDSIYTAPDKNPVYLMVDFTDEDNGGVAASHYCASGATLTADIVKATATTGGHVKYICDTCGSWAQINVPALTLSAFTLDPAYTGIMSTGVEYSGNAYTVVYDVAPAFRRYVGTKLDNHVSVTAPGSYSTIVTVDSVTRITLLCVNMSSIKWRRGRWIYNDDFFARFPCIVDSCCRAARWNSLANSRQNIGVTNQDFVALHHAGFMIFPADIDNEIRPLRNRTIDRL